MENTNFSCRELALFIYFYLFHEKYELDAKTLAQISTDNKRTVLKSLEKILEDKQSFELEIDEYRPIFEDIVINDEMLELFELYILDKRLSWREKGIIMSMVYFEQVPNLLIDPLEPMFYIKRKGNKDAIGCILRAFDRLEELGYIKKK